MRLVEIRTLDGPNLYRLEPAVRIEVAVGRRRTWFGQRQPGRYAQIRLGKVVPARSAPRPVAELAHFVRRLHERALDRRVQVTIHQTSEPGHWVVAYPWIDEGQAETIARAALRLEESGERGGVAQRAIRRVAGAANGVQPAWIRDAERRVPLISISGTNGKSTTTRMITHIARLAGRHVGTTTTDGVLIDERMVEPGDFTGPAGARAALNHARIDLAVLETARGGILLRGLGYESNNVSVLTNVSADHLDLQGLHTLPELAEVKSVICRVTVPSGAVVLNADDALVASVGARVRAPVVLFSERGRGPRLRRHLARGGRALVNEDGWLVDVRGSRRRRIIAATEIPATLGGLARHNIANALAAAAGALALGFSHAQVAAGLREFRISAELMPGRLNLYRRRNRLVIVDYAHNVAGLEVLLDTTEGLIGRRGKRRAALTIILGTAGDRPDDSIRELAALAARHADQVAIKEDLTFLRGRTRAGVIGELRQGLRAGGASPAHVPIYEDEALALEGELTTPGRAAADDGAEPRVLVLMCHAHREEVASYLARSGFKAAADIAALSDFRPAAGTSFRPSPPRPRTRPVRQ